VATAPLPARRLPGSATPTSTLATLTFRTLSGLASSRNATSSNFYTPFSTPFHVSPALGLGSTDKGGAASTADGRWTADASPWATLRKPGLRGTRPPRRRERSVYARRVEGDDLVPLRWFASVRVCMRESRRRLGAGHRVTRATGRTASRTTGHGREPSIVPQRSTLHSYQICITL